MKRWLFLLLWGVLPLSASFAQAEPVKYNWEVQYLEDNTFEIIFKAKIEKGWYTYSMFLEGFDGPIPTSVNFDNNAKAKGVATEKTSKSEYKITGHDALFDMNITKYKKDLTIRQKFTVDDLNKEVSGYLEYMTCNDSECRPPTSVEFAFIPAVVAPESVKRPMPEVPKDPEPTTEPSDRTDNGSVPTTEPTSEHTTVEGPTVVTDTPPSVAVTDPAPTKETPTAPTAVQGTTQNGIFDPSRPSLIATAKHPIGQCEDEVGQNINNNVDVETMPWWQIFLFGFGGGLIALLTPCVLPMIPMTVSLFSKGSSGKMDRKTGIKNGLLFGASIIVIYVTIGMAFTLSFGATALNELSTNWIMNLIFFTLFTFFAFSFLGYYEIQLPSAWVNRADQASSKGGLLGIFFGAFSIALVSFSCTGPIIGALLVTAVSTGDLLNPFVGMFGFSLALALPFMLFAIFPAWIQSLPKSGGWMNNMKVVLGFIELALGLKFLSTADLTQHWGIMPYELFIGLWLLIMILTSAYLFGFIHFPHDNKNAVVGGGRKILGVLAAVLALSLAYGFTINPQTDAFRTPFWLSGLAPSACYSYIHPCDQGEAIGDFKFSDHCPPGTKNCFDDYDEALRYANYVNKPILIDFTGYGCVNCRRMEENVWIDTTVNNLINNEYVLVSLYVDDREDLPQRLKSVDGRTLRKVGDKWSTFQRVNFKELSQPLYVLVTPDEKVLNTPRAYTPDIPTYTGFLQCGLSTFEEYQAEKKK